MEKILIQKTQVIIPSSISEDVGNQDLNASLPRI
jgi:hypothetical protein